MTSNKGSLRCTDMLKKPLHRLVCHRITIKINTLEL
uniref:Uncharacterized protein n=1 Tax=Rhizophora mucronata TaxID=61149 RepID=A0A2P2PBM1_RHIMU